MKNLEKLRNTGILIIRIGIGASYFYVHGSAKLFAGINTWTKVGKAIGLYGIKFYPGFWGFMASISECLGGLLILFGFYTRPAVLFIVFTMFIAASTHIHNGDPLSRIAYPIEMTSVLLGLFFTGGGKYSLDYIIRRKL